MSSTCMLCFLRRLSYFWCQKEAKWTTRRYHAQFIIFGSREVNHIICKMNFFLDFVTRACRSEQWFRLENKHKDAFHSRYFMRNPKKVHLTFSDPHLAVPIMPDKRKESRAIVRCNDEPSCSAESRNTIWSLLFLRLQNSFWFLISFLLNE